MISRMHPQARQLLEQLLGDVRQTKFGLTESTDYRIFGGKSFSELAKLDLKADGFVLLIQLPVVELTDKEHRELARAELEKSVPYEVFTTDRRHANLPATARPFNRNSVYLMHDGKNAIHVGFSGHRKVAWATRYGGNSAHLILGELGDRAVDDQDEEYFS
jgi:hypothetical protein